MNEQLKKYVLEVFRKKSLEEIVEIFLSPTSSREALFKQFATDKAAELEVIKSELDSLKNFDFSTLN